MWFVISVLLRVQCLYKIRFFFQKVRFPSLQFFADQSFYFSVGGSTCSRASMQQMVQESARCFSLDKLMCNGKDIGKLIPQRTS